jgi:hypothetical protein
MRIMRGLSSRFLPCGCLAGIYETYDGEVVGVLDARGPACADRSHDLGNRVPIQPVVRPDGAASPAVEND